MDANLAAAQEKIANWAGFVAGGSLYDPGPRGYSRPMGSAQDHGAPDLDDWQEIEERIRAAKCPFLKQALFNVYYKGEKAGTMRHQIEAFVRSVARGK